MQEHTEHINNCLVNLSPLILILVNLSFGFARAIPMGSLGHREEAPRARTSAHGLGGVHDKA